MPPKPKGVVHLYFDIVYYTQYEDSGTVTVGRYQNSGAQTGTLDIKF